jgi:PAS domain S-box-containing protein
MSAPLDSARVLLVGTTAWVDAFAATLERRPGPTARTVPTAAAALETCRSERVDCVVTEYELAETTGVDLLRSLREERATLPVLLCTAAGDESVASEAITAGVTDYVALQGPPGDAMDDLVTRTAAALRAARREATRRERARQFEATFHDSRTATWVLDPDGTVARANRSALDTPEGDGAVVGRKFWRLARWTRPEGVRADVRHVVERAMAGHDSDVVVGGAAADAPVVDLSARPVRNERDEIVSILVEGVDITERVGLERDLRRSEELHRVTLNNMTDTVLITDDAGEYTYVCPNVNFIFGYTAEEIRGMGTIDELLGEDLFDREELAAEGVLKNIECTATDKAGREHTLLVNVREVSIQDGTLLYSCRDITRRKQREEALATLQATARDFLYAETRQAIAQQVADDTPTVLDLDAGAVYLFDADANDLRPVASTAEMAELHGPLGTVHADGEGLTSHTFVAAESLFFDDVHGADRLENPATGLRSAAYIPLGDHGVFVAGSSTPGEFDETTREVADLLAATAEAALDRVTRESRLREQDRELQRQNERLTELNRINETIREIDRALVQAETREEIDHTVTELLTADDRFRFAWIGTTDPATGTLEPRAWAGDEQGYLDSTTFIAGTVGAEPAERTAATGELPLVDHVADGLREAEWRTDALSRDFLSVLSIPLVYNELTHGVLTVYAGSQDAFDGTARSVLAQLGETVASAISAIERKNALLTTSMTRLEFTLDDSSFVLARLARAADCTLTYQGGVQQTAEGSSVFVTVDGASVDRVERAAAELVAVDEVRHISTESAGGVLRLRLSRPFLALELADHGAVLRSASADPETTTLVVDVPESIEVRHVTQLIRDRYAGVELASKGTLDRSMERDRYAEFLDQVTDRQLEVIQTAYYGGYFESPRETTSEDIAEMLDISPSAFYRHVRTVQRKLFSSLFDDAGVTALARSEPGEVQN